MVHDTTPIPGDIIQCPVCGTHNRHDADACAECGSMFMNDDAPSPITLPLRRPPDTRYFGPTEVSSEVASPTIIFQFLPSGTCVASQLDTPLVMGRECGDDVNSFINLMDFNGEKHGVSRQHCILHRRDSQLLIADLGSTNGTYLNGQRLVPNKGYAVTHGDKLILGSLHIMVNFTE